MSFGYLSMCVLTLPVGAFWFKTVVEQKDMFIQDFFESGKRATGADPCQIYTELFFHALRMQPSVRLDFLNAYELVASWERYNRIASATDWNTLTILLHSDHFCQQAREYPEERWNLIVEALRNRLISVKSVGYECFPKWRKTFDHALPGQEDLLVDDGFPVKWRNFARYKYRVTGDGIEAIPQKYEYLTNCRHTMSNSGDQGPELPETLPVADGWKCSMCKNRYCTCAWEFIHPIRVETFAINVPGFGEYATGLRSLEVRSSETLCMQILLLIVVQELPEGTIIGQYTGEFLADEQVENGDLYVLSVGEKEIGPPDVPETFMAPSFTVTARNAGK
jgi:hypothetical protein